MPRRLFLVSLLATGSSHAQQETAAPVDTAPVAVRKDAVPAPALKNEPATADAAPAAPSVEIRGAVDAIRRNETATKIVVPNEELVKYGDPNVLDAMKRLPGVTVQGTSVRMRGLGNGYTQILVNGERPSAGFSLDTLAPDMVERVEIVRAATAEFSTQAIAGTINIVLKKAVTKGASEVKVLAGGAHGQHNASTNLSTSDRSDNLSYTLGANLNFNRNTNPSYGTVVRNAANVDLTENRNTTSVNTSQAEGINLNSRLNWRLKGEDSFTWQTFANQGYFKGSNDDRTATLTGPAYPSLLVADFNGMFRNLRSDMNWVAKFVDGGTLDAKLGISGSDNECFVGRQGRSTANALVLDRDYTTRGNDRGVSTTGKYTAPWLTGHSIAFGWDLGYARYHENEVQDDTDVKLDFNNNFSATITRLAAFVQDEWDITKDLSMYLGARWEGVRTHATAIGIDSGSHLSVLSPLMQTLYKIPGRKGDQLRFALTRTYKAPGLWQLVPRHFYSSFNTAVSPDSSGNPGLKPELALGIDAAFEHYWSEGALLSVAVSSRKIEGLIRNEVLPVGDRYVSAPYNQGKAHVKGLELEAKFPLKAVIKDAPNVDVRASVSRNWSTVDGVPGPGSRLDNQPRLSANFGADIKLGQWNGGASFSYVEGSWSRTSLTDSRFNSSRRDLEAYLLYKFTPKILLRITARDLLRPDNVSKLRFDDPNGSYESMSTSPVRPGWRIAYEHKL
ncbi:TonB-dependent receptor plug domain-containing protein [Undibacterium sp. Ji49W]|uniref:TonB-dependent receptor plug domain-containing protein n=1 Tax=Undibacterium sp. Ji49W TaxID=3413040 RepID=UPI003BF42918